MKKKILTIASVCLILMLATLPMACGEVEPGPSPEPGPTPTPGPGPVTPTPPVGEPQYGGILRISRPQAGYTVYPVEMFRGDDFVNIGPTIETLIAYDETGAPIPWLATSWDVDTEALTYTIHLREGVKFHDGTDFNAEVCKWNMDKYRAAGRAELQKVTSVDIIDDYTIRLKLPSFDNLLVTNLGIYAGMMISKEAYEKHGKDWCISHAVGTGPFKLVSWEKDVIMEFERFDDYWQEGKPYLDAIEIHIISDPLVQLAAFLKGDHDITMAPNPRDAKDIQVAGKQVLDSVTASEQIIAGDGIHPTSIYSDIRVRRAVEYAIDKEAICGSIGFDLWRPAYQFAKPGGWGENLDVVGYHYNPDKARELLAEAGYPDGLKTTLNTVNQPRSTVDYMSAVQGYLAEVGIDADLGVYDRAVEMKAAIHGGWEDSIWTWGHGFYAPDATMSLNRLFTRGSILFESKFNCDELQDTLAEAIKAPTFEEKATLTQQVQYLMVDKYCMVSYMHLVPSLSARYPQAHDAGLNQGSSSLQWTPQDAWLSR